MLETHSHKVKELIHARFIQPHDGRMRELVEDLTSRTMGVDLLRLEQLLNELYSFPEPLQKQIMTRLGLLGSGY